MRRHLMFAALVFSLCMPALADDFDGAPPPWTDEIVNPKIDMPAYLSVANEAAVHRVKRRVSEADFMRLAREPGTVVLDARSREKYDLLHVRGAINLSFPDIDVASLAQTLPDKNARILIYCNNNFGGDQRAFATKSANASLNLSTFIALYSYGYRNVYELGPYVNVADTRLELVPTPRLARH